MTGFRDSWNAYLCAMYGHVVKGVGTGTSPKVTLLANYCSRCGAKVSS